MAPNETEFATKLQDRIDDTLGAVSDVGPRASFPVAGLTAKPLAARRTALIGDAGHSLPPIGAQGLNLGLRDAAALADCVSDALRHGRDLGGPLVLNSYIRARQLDVLSRSFGRGSLEPLTADRFLTGPSRTRRASCRAQCHCAPKAVCHARWARTPSLATPPHATSRTCLLDASSQFGHDQPLQGTPCARIGASSRGSFCSNLKDDLFGQLQRSALYDRPKIPAGVCRLALPDRHCSGRPA